MIIFEQKRISMTLKIRCKEDSLVEIGVDEAGRGSFWGPIMAGAVILPSEWTDEQRAVFLQLRDSKKIAPKKRATLSNQLKQILPHYGIGIVTAEEINKNGITWANKEAFHRAIQESIQKATVEPVGTRVLIDGVLGLDSWEGEQELIIEGDNQYIAIAAASILAKVAHDEWIHAYCTEHPECNERYDLLKSNGYGTAKHREGIHLYGGHELHRIVYIANWLPGASHIGKKRGKKEDKCLIQFT